MNKAGKINLVLPPAAIEGGEVMLECEDFSIGATGTFACLFDGMAGRIIGASSKRVLVNVPSGVSGTKTVQLENEGALSEPRRITLGRKIHEDLHIVANPAISPEDGSIIVTRSGSRGQKLPVTLFRLTQDGYLSEISGEVMNPTGAAFDQTGKLFVTSRAEGAVYRINNTDDAIPFASDMGIATGIAFDKQGKMYVGDRTGTIYKVSGIGDTETFATLEPSIAAYHLAFGTDGFLYVTAPSVASFDTVWRIDQYGEVETFYRGLGRPQGLAFDKDGNLYVAACLKGRRGIVKITPERVASLFVAGNNVVGLCFSAEGEMIVATNEAVFALPLGIYGTLLD